IRSCLPTRKRLTRSRRDHQNRWRTLHLRKRIEAIILKEDILLRRDLYLITNETRRIRSEWQAKRLCTTPQLMRTLIQHLTSSKHTHHRAHSFIRLNRDVQIKLLPYSQIGGRIHLSDQCLDAARHHEWHADNLYARCSRELCRFERIARGLCAV